MFDEEIDFKGVKPEEAGIPSKAVIAFIQDLDRNGFCMHGFMMIKDGKVITEGYYKPFTVDTPHRMYSVGKSFTSIAIGLLQEEGKLSIEDKICDYFKDKLPKEVHPYIEKTTIKDMLKMATPHSSATYKQEDDDWVRTFFTVKPTHLPGTSFGYDTSSTHVLSALVERLSGKSLLEYLQDKLFTPLNCSRQIRWLTCPMGICQGGSGLICTLRDLAKVAYTCMKSGKYKGEQLIPEAYIKQAASYQISTCLQSFSEEQEGYGYQFWRCRNNSFSLYGMGGQLAVCIPERNFMLVTEADNTANPNGVQGIYDALFRCIYPYLSKKEVITGNQNDQKRLADSIKNLSIKTEKGEKNSEIVLEINEKGYQFKKNKMGIERCSFKFLPGEESGVFRYTNDTGRNQIKFGLGHMERQKFPGTKYDCITSAAWIHKKVLHFRSYVIDECYASVNITATFLENTITLAMKKTSEPFLSRYDGYATGDQV